MSGHELLIMLITTIAVTSLVVVAYIQSGANIQDKITVDEEAKLRIVGVLATNITSQGANHVRISITAAKGAVRINDTLIILRAQGESANLKYRSGLLERNITEGFYTQ